MAKAVEKEVAAQENIYAGISPQEIAMMLSMSGQSANTGYEKAPTLKINYTSKKDKAGNKVEVGNFVLGQVIKTVDGTKVVEEIGKDFGPTPEATIFKVVRQYSYYNDKKDLRCSSQLITEANEVATGSTLKHDCASGKCPRRSKEAAKGEKCSCQYVVYLEIGPDKDRCIMYFKGSSFMPFKEYLDAVGQDPVMFFPTIFKTKEKSQGNVDYYEIYPEIDKSRPYPVEVRKENLDKLRVVSKDITAYKAQQSIKQLSYVEAEVSEASSEDFDDIAF